MKTISLQENLRRILWQETKNGGLTGTALARKANLQQAHISNFMNRKRGLSVEAMDRVLAALQLSVLDLLDRAEVNERADIPASAEANFQNVSVVAVAVAATARRITRRLSGDVLKFRTSFLEKLGSACEPSRTQWDRFVGIEVEAREAMSMFPRLVPGATVLIDRHYTQPKAYRRGEYTMFLVRKGDDGCTIRYLETGRECVILRPHNHAYPVEMLRLKSGEEMAHYIVGRVAYVGMET